MVTDRLFPSLVMVFLASFYTAPIEVGMLLLVILSLSGLFLGALGLRRWASLLLLAAAGASGAMASVSLGISSETLTADTDLPRAGIWECTVEATTRRGALLGIENERVWAGSRILALSVKRGDSVTVMGSVSNGFLDVSLFSPDPSSGIADRARRTLCQIWTERIPSLMTRSMISTLAAGERGELPYTARDLFRSTGTTHLLAVSGLHVGLVAAAFLLLAGRLGAGRWTSLAVCMGAVAVYVLLTGARASTLRAALMALMVLLAVRIDGRSPDLLAIWSIAAVILVCLTRGAVLHDVGAQMSFTAVLSLILFGRRFTGKFSKARSILFAGCIVCISMAPLVSYVYGDVSLAAPAATLMSLPFMLTLMCLAPFILLPIPLGSIAAHIAEWSAYLWIALLGVIRLPGLEVSGGGLIPWMLSVALLWLVSKRGGFFRRFI